MWRVRVYSLFIGRYQPLHDGHCALFRAVLAEGKRVCVAIRDTPLSDANPHTLTQRIGMVWAAFPEECGDGRMRVVPLPDIAEVCHGRDVGWSVRRVEVDAEVEAISATAIREARHG